MCHFLYQNNKVTSRATCRPFVTFTLDTQLHTISHSTWNLDGGFIFFGYQALIIGIARFTFYDFSIPLANRTSALGSHLAKKRIGYLLYHTRSTTMAATTKFHAFGRHHTAIFYFFLY